MATRLKLIRTVQSVKQVELARRVGVSRSYLSLVEGGWARPSDALAARIAEALTVRVGWLFQDGHDGPRA